MTRDERARVAAAHRDDDIGLVSELCREPLRAPVRQVDPELAHDLNDGRMDALVGVGFGAGRQGVVAAVRGAVKERGAHLRAPGAVLHPRSSP